MRPAPALVPTGSGVTAVTSAEPEPPVEAARVPGRRAGAAGSAAGASRSATPPAVPAAIFAAGEPGAAWGRPTSAGASWDFDSTASSLGEPGRWMNPMRTAPKPTAASARTTTPTMRSAPPPFWPPPVSSALAAILVPLLLVSRRRCARRRGAGARGRGRRRRRRVEAVGRCGELRHGRTRAVVLVVRGQLEVRDGHDAAHVGQLGEERTHRVVV